MRLSAPDAPTAVAAARASTAWAWATAAQTAAVAWPSPWPSSLYASAARSPGAAVMLRPGHRYSTYLVALAQRVIPHTFLLTFPDAFMPATATRPGTGPTDMA